jgi:hypothetical protein
MSIRIFTVHRCQRYDMTVGRSRQREDRRRRVLVDDRINDIAKADGGPGPIEAVGRAKPYAEAALIMHQPRITDFIPVRLWAVAAWFSIGVIVIGTHGLLAWLSVRGQFGQFTTLFDVTRSDSIASWTTAVMLLVAASLGRFIYSIRRHRIDDYRGRYRLWIWITILLVMASLDATVGLGQAIHAWILSATVAYPTAVPESAKIVAGALGFAIWLRLLVELKTSRGATAWLLTAAIFYVAAVVLRLSEAGRFSGSQGEILATFAVMIGHWLLTMSLIVYGRYVFLDSQGELVERTKHAARRAQTKTNGRTGSSQVKTPSGTKKRMASETSDPDLEPSVISISPAQPPGSPIATIGRSPASSADRPSSAQPDSTAPSMALSRAERKRLRKEEKRHNRAA